MLLSLASKFGAASTSKNPTVIQTAKQPERFVTRLPSRVIGWYIMYELRSVSANGSLRPSLNSGIESRLLATSAGIAPFERTDSASSPKPASRASPNVGVVVDVPHLPSAARLYGCLRSIEASTPNCIICISGTRSPASGERNGLAKTVGKLLFNPN